MINFRNDFPMKLVPKLIGCSLVGLLFVQEAFAAKDVTKIGVTTIVKNKVLGEPPKMVQRKLKTGLEVYFNEKVETGPVGRTQLLFKDGTAITIGPNANMTIDKYVFDPNAGTGDMALSVTKGVFRIVGGRISKRKPIKLKTPVATLGVMGGIVVVDQAANGKLNADFLFGNKMTVTANNVTVTTKIPGRFISVTGSGQAPGPSQKRDRAEMKKNLEKLEGGGAEEKAAAPEEKAAPKKAETTKSEGGKSETTEENKAPATSSSSSSEPPAEENNEPAPGNEKPGSTEKTDAAPSNSSDKPAPAPAGGEPSPNNKADPGPGGSQPGSAGATETAAAPMPGGEGGMMPMPGGEGGMMPMPGGEGGMMSMPGGEGGMMPMPGGEGGMMPMPGGEGGMMPMMPMAEGGAMPMMPMAEGGAMPMMPMAEGGAMPMMPMAEGGAMPMMPMAEGGAMPMMPMAEGGAMPMMPMAEGGAMPMMPMAQGGAMPMMPMPGGEGGAMPMPGGASMGMPNINAMMDTGMGKMEMAPPMNIQMIMPPPPSGMDGMPMMPMPEPGPMATPAGEAPAGVTGDIGNERNESFIKQPEVLAAVPAAAFINLSPEEVASVNAVLQDNDAGIALNVPSSTPNPDGSFNPNPPPGIFIITDPALAGGAPGAPIFIAPGGEGGFGPPPGGEGGFSPPPNGEIGFGLPPGGALPGNGDTESPRAGEGCVVTPENPCDVASGGPGGALVGDGVAGSPGDGVAGSPGDGVAGSPGDGVAGSPGDGVAGSPGDGVAGSPGDGVAGSPGDGVAGSPGDGVAGSPDDGGSEANPPPSQPIIENNPPTPPMEAMPPPFPLTVNLVVLTTQPNSASNLVPVSESAGLTYLVNNPDVMIHARKVVGDSGIAPGRDFQRAMEQVAIDHYNNFGRKEGRQLDGVISARSLQAEPKFNEPLAQVSDSPALTYLINNPDVMVHARRVVGNSGVAPGRGFQRAMEQVAIDHYNNFGRKEGRASPR